MKLGSLFDGISGFPLAASWCGIETKWISEIDEYCLKVSKKNFPNAKQYKDIREISFPEPVDIISGGFPCQPFSVAGKQQGKEDNRYLWPEMLRIIREVKPSWIIGENVPGIVKLALDEVLASLEDIGYTTETFVIPACGVGAPHRRDRVWIIAYSDKIRSGRRSTNSDRQDKNEAVRTNFFEQTDRLGEEWTSSNSNEQHGDISGLRTSKVPQFEKAGVFENFGAYSNGERFQELNIADIAAISAIHTRDAIERWEKWPTKSGVCGRDDGIPNRLDRIKALGNAIVPQVAYEIFKAIQDSANTLNKQ